MFDRYIPHSLQDFIPLQEPDAPLPPPEKRHTGNHAIPRSVPEFLKEFSLSGLDTGDLLLLGLFVYLIRRKADEELLIAMGLLLIL